MPAAALRARHRDIVVLALPGPVKASGEDEAGRGGRLASRSRMRPINSPRWSHRRQVTMSFVAMQLNDVLLAIEAAMNPEFDGALYFVATGEPDGSHAFSATLEEHNQAVSRYLQRQRAGAE